MVRLRKLVNDLEFTKFYPTIWLINIIFKLCASTSSHKKKWKSENLENLENSQHFQIFFQISDFKICTSQNVHKKSEKIANKIISKSFSLLFSMTKIFLIEISRKHYFDSKTHVCDIRRDLASWPIIQEYVWKILNNSSKKNNFKK